MATWVWWVPDLRLVRKQLLPQGFSHLFKTNRVLGRRKGHVKGWEWPVSDLSCPHSVQVLEFFFTGPPSQPHCHSGFRVKRAKMSCPMLESLDLLPCVPTTCHLSPVSLSHFRGPEGLHLGMPLPAHVHTHLHGGGVICSLCCVGARVQESVCLFESTF